MQYRSSLFDIETQRRTEVIDTISITPSMEVLFDSAEAMKEKLEAFSNISKNQLEELDDAVAYISALVDKLRTI